VKGRTLIAAFVFMVPLPLHAQDLEVGRTGWSLERLSDRFVLLRTEIHDLEANNAARRQGLLLLTCDNQSRRIRFQIGESPRQPSTHAGDSGRAMVQGERDGQRLAASPLNPRARFYSDGSFEFLEAIGFSDAIMNQFLQLLKKLPTRINIVLFKGPETGAFRRGTTIQLTMRNLDAALPTLYGFEGLCYRSPE